MEEESPTLATRLRHAFISGLLLLAPIAVTLWVFAALFEKVGGGFSQHVFAFLPVEWHDYPLLINILTTFLVIVIITVLGFISKYFLGRYFASLTERAILGIPGVGAVYQTVKQIVDTFGKQRSNSFSQVVLVEFPRPGSYTLGFLTGKQPGEAAAKAGLELWSVFVPTTPNPTGGYLLLLPPSAITPLEMSVGDGMKMVISGGAVVPPWPSTKA